MTHVHVSSNQSLTHGQSLSCFCENDYYVDELTSVTVTCQADGDAEMFRVGRQTCTVSAMRMNAWICALATDRDLESAVLLLLEKWLIW